MGRLHYVAETLVSAQLYYKNISNLITVHVSFARSTISLKKNLDKGVDNTEFITICMEKQVLP